MNTKKIISSTISFLLLLLALYLMLSVIIAKVEERPTKLFGYSLHLVITDSMTGEIEPGDLIIARDISIEEVKLYDNVLFISERLNGVTVVHKVINIAVDGDGNVLLTTKGVKTGATVDPDPVVSSNLVGISVVSSAFWGKIYMLFSTPLGLLVLVISVTSIVIVIRQVKKLLKLNKKEEERV